MARQIWTRTALVVILALAGVAPAAQASPASGQICKTFNASGLTKIEWSVIGDVTCNKAKPWLLKILTDKGKADAQIAVKNGPKGFHCRATADAKGRPAGGTCYTGTIQFPTNGFQWFA
jgi:hypothetical protein